MPSAARTASSHSSASWRCALVVLVLLAVAIPTAAARPVAERQPWGRVVAPGLQYLRPDAIPAGPRSSLGFAAGTFSPPPNTDFALSFGASVDATTRQVVTAAAGVWSSVLDVRVPIAVEVTMEAMDAGLLGAAGPTTAHFGRASFPQPDVLYPVAQANQFAGTDLDPGLPDVRLVLSSSMVWDKSVDGTVTPTGQSMLSVAIHELGHGLGHTSWVRRTTTGMAVNYVVDGVTVALAFDRLAATSTGATITSLSDETLATSVTAPLYWVGSGGRSVVGSRPRLYAPPVFELGSSIGHLDEVTFGSGVMTPVLARGEVHTRIPALTRAMLADTGWRISDPSAPPPSTVTSAAEIDAFVDAVARDFVRRAPTAQEVVRWREHLLAGGSRGEVTRHYAYSDEWIGVLVDGLYRSTLGRDPDAGGRAHWIDVIRSGVTPAEVAAFFYASDEYFSRSGGTAAAWVRDLYAEILGRQPDAAGWAFWVGRTATVPRALIAFEFYQSLESRRDRVEALFERLLDRAPDAGGWTYWAEVLRSGRDVDLAVFLAASDEYFSRST